LKQAKHCLEISFKETYSKAVNLLDSSLAIVWVALQFLERGAESRAALSLDGGLSFPRMDIFNLGSLSHNRFNLNPTSLSPDMPSYHPHNSLHKGEIFASPAPLPSASARAWSVPQLPNNLSPTRIRHRARNTSSPPHPQKLTFPAFSAQSKIPYSHQGSTSL